MSGLDSKEYDKTHKNIELIATNANYSLKLIQIHSTILSLSLVHTVITTGSDCTKFSQPL